MSTRSNIGIKEGDKIRYIYCHWDGYPENQYPLLTENYDTKEKVDELIDLGDISSLAPRIGTKHNFDEDSERIVNAYHRDRGESWSRTKPRIAETVNQIARENTDSNYIYLFNNGKWEAYEAPYGQGKVKLLSESEIAKRIAAGRQERIKG